MTTSRSDVGRPSLGAYTPDAVGRTPDTGGPPSRPARRLRILRWRGILPLALVFAAAVAALVLFGDRIVESTAEEALTEALGAQVEIDGLRLDLRRARLDLRAVSIADPFDPTRNLVETGRVRAELEPAPLLEKKVVVRRLSVTDVALGRRRAVPATPAPRDGFAGRTLAELRRWRAQFDVPPLRLTPIDTIRALVVDPTQLTTVKEALALRARADSLRGALDSAWTGLRLEQAADSARTIGARLAATNVRALDLAGARRLAEEAKRGVAELDAARRRVDALRATGQAGLDALRDGVGSLDAARRRDYAFARGLLALPSFDGPELGNALLGDVALDQVQRAVYWAQLAQRHMPPGLRPRETAGPERRRAPGTTVRFARARAYPTFHLVRGDLSLTLDEGAAAVRYSAAVADLTTEPALVGRPARFAMRRAGGGDFGAARAAGWLDHAGAIPRDSVGAAAGAVRLPTFDVPGLPYRADLGRGAMTLDFVRVGERIDARWTVRSAQLSWTADSTRVRSLGPLESLAGRVLTGLRDVDIDARVSGDLRAPELRVRSSLDRALAERLRAVAGEEVRRAELRARAKVDSLVAGQADAARDRVAEVRAEADRRLAAATARLEAERRVLDERVRAAMGGAVGLPGLPGAELPTGKLPAPKLPASPTPR